MLICWLTLTVPEKSFRLAHFLKVPLDISHTWLPATAAPTTLAGDPEFHKHDYTISHHIGRWLKTSRAPPYPLSPLSVEATLLLSSAGPPPHPQCLATAEMKHHSSVCVPMRHTQRSLWHSLLVSASLIGTYNVWLLVSTKSQLWFHRL